MLDEVLVKFFYFRSHWFGLHTIIICVVSLLGLRGKKYKSLSFSSRVKNAYIESETMGS